MLPDLALQLEVGVRFLLIFFLEKIMSDKSSIKVPPLSPRQPASTAFSARFQIEQEHWRSVLTHIEEPATAQLIVDLFTQHQHLQASHPAVYLRAQRCIARSEKQAASAKAAGKTCRLIAQTVSSALYLMATTALKGATWTHAKVRRQPTQRPVNTTELSWPELAMPDA